MIANVCDCKENCFSYVKIGVKIIKNKEYYEKIKISKCNRSLIENSRKKPCDFYEEKVISTNEIIKNEDKIEDDPKQVEYETLSSNIVPKKNIITFESIKKDIINKFTFYEYPGTNYYANLNKNLLLLGYKVHIPSLETLQELKERIKKSPSNPNILHGFSKERFLSISIGDLSEEYEIDKDIYEKIYENQSKEDSFLIYKDDFIKDILKHKKKSKKKKNKRKKITEYTFGKTLENIDDTGKIDNLDTKFIDDDDEDNVEDNKNSKVDLSDDSEESKEESESSDQDKEFDMDNYSEDEEEFGNEEYDDFSD